MVLNIWLLFISKFGCNLRGLLTHLSELAVKNYFMRETRFVSLILCHKSQTRKSEFRLNLLHFHKSKLSVVWVPYSITLTWNINRFGNRTIFINFFRITDINYKDFRIMKCFDNFMIIGNWHCHAELHTTTNRTQMTIDPSSIYILRNLGWMKGTWKKVATHFWINCASH